MRLIDKDALMADCQLAQKQADRHGREFANAFYSGGGEISTEWWCVEDMIESAPTIEERKKGEWIPEFDGKFAGGAYWFSCSKCKRIVPEVRNGGWNYCPNCGADMRGTDE